MSLEHVTGLTCVKCQAKYGLEVEYTCPRCGTEGILDVGYDYARVKATLTREALAKRPAWAWRYQELLPIRGDAQLPHLSVGMTPVYDVPRLAAAVGVKGLWLKDDGRNPTGSFKDRASSVGVVKAMERGQKTIACASTGNGASSLAGFAAAAGLRAFIFVPERAPEPKVTQLLIFGANVLRVRGTYDQAYELCQQACARYGWYNRNCAVNPYLVEGKKTVGLEIAEQLPTTVPDWLVVSVGDGCTLAGAWKGCKEMKEIGLWPALPRLLGVQAAGAARISAAWRENRDVINGAADTFADSIAVGHPRNWRKALNAIRESGGAMLDVEDEETREAMRQAGRLAAVFAEPAGAASVAGLRRAVETGVVGRHETALVVVTGNGLKDIRAATSAVQPGLEVEPSVQALESSLKGRGLL